jgi:hypothetical protein
MGRLMRIKGKEVGGSHGVRPVKYINIFHWSFRL